MGRKTFANPLDRGSAGSTLQAREPERMIVLRYDYSQIEPVHRQELENDARTYRLREERIEQDLLANAAIIVRWRELLPHGQFQDWVRTELEITPRKAQMMMNVAEQYEGKSETVSLLGLTNAQLLAAPSVSDDAREQAEEEAKALRQDGGKLTKRRAQEIISETKRAELALPTLDLDQTISLVWAAIKDDNPASGNNKLSQAHERLAWLNRNLVDWGSLARLSCRALLDDDLLSRSLDTVRVELMDNIEHLRRKQGVGAGDAQAEVLAMRQDLLAALNLLTGVRNMALDVLGDPLYLTHVSSVLEKALEELGKHGR